MSVVLGVDGVAREVEDDPAPGPLPDGCRLVLEGYPRSANTFAALAFERCNPGVPFAHHGHHPDAVRAGLALGLPAIVLVRDPVDACASFCVFDEGLSPGRAVRRWLRFYRPLVGRLGELRLLDFADAITPALLATFEAAGFDVSRETSWEVFSRAVLAEIRSRDGMAPPGVPWSAEDSRRARTLAAPSASRRLLLAAAREEVGAQPEIMEALDLYGYLREVASV